MLRFDKWHLLAMSLVLMLLAAGCQRREEAKAPAGRAEKVRATEAYLTYFGEPPTVEGGTCYAQVGFYPLAAEPRKLRPFPLFLFNKEKRLELVTGQLLHWGEGWDLGGVLLNPFPKGTELLSVSREGDVVRVELSPEIREAEEFQRQVALNVIGLTLTQFDDVSRVMVVAGGELLPNQAESGFMPDSSIVADPGEPLALAVAGTWENGEKGPGEVSVFFDRPIDVEKIDLSDGRGNPLKGDLYRSVFDMAVVLHPADPSGITEEMPVRVAWKISDRLGRKGEGERTFKLKRLEHP